MFDVHDKNEQSICLATRTRASFFEKIDRRPLFVAFYAADRGCCSFLRGTRRRDCDRSRRDDTICGAADVTADNILFRSFLWLPSCTWPSGATYMHYAQVHPRVGGSEASINVLCSGSALWHEHPTNETA